MATTLKLVVGNVIDYGNGGTSYAFYPDYQDGANKEWAAATPTASLNFTIKEGLDIGLKQGDHVTVTLEK